MSSRTNLQDLLENLLQSHNVYFQPPASVQLKYPAIVYSLNPLESVKADDQKYLIHRPYTLTYIHKNPDDPMTDKIYALPKCRFDRRFASDNLYHDVYTIYY